MVQSQLTRNALNETKAEIAELGRSLTHTQSEIAVLIRFYEAQFQEKNSELGVATTNALNDTKAELDEVERNLTHARSERAFLISYAASLEENNNEPGVAQTRGTTRTNMEVRANAKAKKSTVRM